MFDEMLLNHAARLIALYRDRGLMLATAESCTGGLVAALLTEIAGSSAVVERGFVTYSNAAKESMIGVPTVLLEQHGAVSEKVARAMAEGALIHSEATIAVSITGIAGPGGGSAEKPIGLVHFAVARKGHGCDHVERRFVALSRTEVRRHSIAQALVMLEVKVLEH